MDWLNYHHFMYFKCIAEEGSIVAASKKLMVGQPALSAQLKQFEESLGHQLFERKNRKLILTSAGYQALQYAKEIDKLGKEFLDSMRDQSFAAKMKYQIGSLDSIPKRLIAKIVKAIHKEYPHCEVKLLEGEADYLMREMDLFHLDLVIANYSGLVMELGKSYYSKSIGRSSVNLYGTKKYAKIKDQLPKCLNKVPMILPTRASKLRSDIDHFFALRGIRPNIVAETQDTSLQKTLGTEGVGVVPMSDYSFKTVSVNRGLEKIGTFKNVFEEYWVIAPEKFQENEITKNLLDHFKV